MAKTILNRIIITFRNNQNKHIVSPNQVSQYWHDLKGITTSEKLEIAIPIGVFIEMKDDRVFQSHFADVVRVRTSQRDILGMLCYHSINYFDNRLDDNQLNDILSLKHS